MHSDRLSSLLTAIGKDSGQVIPDARSEVFFGGSSIELFMKGSVQINEFQYMWTRLFPGGET